MLRAALRRRAAAGPVDAARRSADVRRCSRLGAAAAASARCAGRPRRRAARAAGCRSCSRSPAVALLARSPCARAPDRRARRLRRAALGRRRSPAALIAAGVTDRPRRSCSSTFDTSHGDAVVAHRLGRLPRRAPALGRSASARPAWSPPPRPAARASRRPPGSPRRALAPRPRAAAPPACSASRRCAVELPELRAPRRPRGAGRAGSVYVAAGDLLRVVAPPSCSARRRRAPLPRWRAAAVRLVIAVGSALPVDLDGARRSTGATTPSWRSSVERRSSTARPRSSSPSSSNVRDHGGVALRPAAACGGMPQQLAASGVPVMVAPAPAGARWRACERRRPRSRTVAGTPSCTSGRRPRARSRPCSGMPERHVAPDDVARRR